MTFEQTIIIPENHTLLVDIPAAMPCGPAFLTLTAQPSDTMRLSEASLSRDWNNPEEDDAWADL